MNDPKTAPIPSELIAKLIDATAVVNACNAEISQIVLDHVGVKQGDILEDKNTGNQYRVVSARGYRTGDMHGITLYCNRYYKSGRRAGMTARGSSHIQNISNYMKIEVDAPR